MLLKQSDLGKMAINLNVLESGDLEIAVTDREEFEDVLRHDFRDERHYLAHLMESARYIGNDWDCPYCIGLTEAPAIGQGAIYAEDEKYNDGLPIDYENLWYFPNYMVFSYLEILEKEGRVIFTGHSENIINNHRHNKKQHDRERIYYLSSFG